MTRPSTRFASVVRAMRRCGHWEITGRTNAHAAEIRHAESGESLWFAIHDGGNDVNAVRNFAADAQRVCGCRFVEPRGRKAGRRTPHAAGGGIPYAVPAWPLPRATRHRHPPRSTRQPDRGDRHPAPHTTWRPVRDAARAAARSHRA